MTHQITRLAEAVTITPHTDIEVVRLVEAVKASGPQIIRAPEELEALDRDTVLVTRLGETWTADTCVNRDLPAMVVATGDQFRAANKALGDAA